MNGIEVERQEFGLMTCKSCAFSGKDEPKKKGVMNWAHKTGATIQIMTESCWKEQKKYYVANGARSAVKNFSKSISV